MKRERTRQKCMNPFWLLYAFQCVQNQLYIRGMDEIDIMSVLISCYKFVQVQILISAMSKGQFRPKVQVPDL